jgi:hypothetical protein
MAGRLHRYTYGDYVALEQDSTTKHEFLDGEIYAMGGGTEEHSALAAEVLSMSSLVPFEISHAAFTHPI